MKYYKDKKGGKGFDEAEYDGEQDITDYELATSVYVSFKDMHILIS